MKLNVWHLDELDIRENDSIEISRNDDENVSLEFDIGNRGIKL